MISLKLQSLYHMVKKLSVGLRTDVEVLEKIKKQVYGTNVV